MNPLGQLAKQLGVSFKDVAALAGMDADMVSEVLSESPPLHVDAYLRLMSALGTRLRLAPAPPLSAWFDLQYLDGLYDDPAFRKKMNLLPVPKTRGELRDLVVGLAADNGPTAVKQLLEASLIPTSSGVQVWNRGNIPQTQKLPVDFESKDQVLDRPDWVRKEWRQWAVDQITDQFCHYDPLAFVRHGFQWKIRDGLLFAENEDKMPAKAREWIIESLSRIEWIVGRWGVV